MGESETIPKFQAFKTNNNRKLVTDKELHLLFEHWIRRIYLESDFWYIGGNLFPLTTHYSLSADKQALFQHSTIPIFYFQVRRSRIRLSFSVRVPFSINSSLSILTVHISLKTFSNSLSSPARSSGPASTFRVK